jgi:hypothetical protein
MIKELRLDYRKCFTNSALSSTAKRFSPTTLPFGREFRLIQDDQNKRRSNFADYMISEIRLTVELIEKTLRFKHTDIMKIPELDRVARFF